MATPHHSRHGSMAYYPRRRAKSLVPHVDSWPEIDEGPKVQGFAGYKVGMTHVLMVDWRKKSETAGQEISIPVTVVEVPPLGVAGIRFYRKSTYGLQVYSEIWSNNLEKELSRIISIPKKDQKEKIEKLNKSDIDEVRLIVYTKPSKVTGVPKKKPEIMEMRVGGGTIEQRIDYALGKLGKEITFKDFSSPGKLVDVIAVTKGKGFQGHIKRFGVKLLPRKNRKHRRMIGTLGPWHPNWIMFTVPMAGQLGNQQRTEYNKRIIKFVNVENNKPKEDVNPEGGFLNYGLVRNPYILVHGSIPGTTKRLIRFRDPIRPTDVNIEENEIKLVYVSRNSKQGV
ncbi:MAG: 50S ribosomal protein L3 [Thermoplasmata archaeon]|nr:50S ribosomal protein L3 [Thermoplasmata archaeon]